jgi:hypothetical protein
LLPDNTLPIVSQRRLTSLERAGWLLYFASLVTPGADLKSYGAKMLMLAPYYGYLELSSASLTGRILGLALFAGFAANLSVCMRLPRAIAVASILAPWAAFAAYVSLIGPVRLQALLRIAYFFPWALGIALINVERLRRARRD